MQQKLTAIFASNRAAQQQFLREHAGTLERVVRHVAEALRLGNKLLLFGNGGSAADAQHIAAEFVNRFVIERPPLAALALTTDTSALTSIANDYGYAQVFAKQVRALGRAGDVAFAFSTSGNSPSVLNAVRACRAARLRTVALTGGSGGKLGAMVDHHLCVSHTTDTARIQETHILVGHAICALVDDLLFGATAAPARPAHRRRVSGRTVRR